MADLNKQFSEAVGNNSVEDVARLLEKRADPNFRAQFNRTPLERCTFMAYDPAMKIAGLLIKAGADVNAKGELEGTPLHSYCFTPFPDLARLVIEAGADVNATDGEGRQPWLRIPDSDCYAAKAEALNQLLKDAGATFDDPFRLVSAIKNGLGASEVERLLKEGCDPNLQQSGGGTALALAAGAGDLRSAELLLGAGADVEAGNGEALPAAVRLGHLGIVKLLLEAGLNAGRWPALLCELPTADEEASLACARELLAAGAHVDGQPRERPVERMSAAGCWTIVQQLLEAGADLNVKQVEDYFDNGPRARETEPIYGLVKSRAESANAQEVLAAIAARAAAPPPAAGGGEATPPAAASGRQRGDDAKKNSCGMCSAM